MTNDRFIIPAISAKTRLDLFLADRFSMHSRSYLQTLITKGHVQLNGKIAKKQELVSGGETVAITFTPPPEMSLKPEAMPLDILYEDSDLLALNKSPGVVVHPGAGNHDATLIAGVLYYLKKLPKSDDPLRPGVVHRLDKDTSGVILIAKSTVMHRKLIELFSERKIEKSYLALCHGYPQETIINAPIGRHPVHRTQMAINGSNQKPAKTLITTLQKGNGLTLIKAQPETGRTHQIRVHLKHIKAPIVGDPVYGPKKPLTSRQMLHAYSLSFIHPISGKQIKIQALPPKDFLDTLAKKLSFDESALVSNLKNPCS